MTSIWQRIKRATATLFGRNIDEYFKESRRTFVPVVQGGMWVDHETALCLSAVFAAVRYISETIAALPWELRQRRADGGSDLAMTHNVYRLLRSRPNPEMSAFTWRMLMTANANTWGNAYAEIERDVMGRPVALWPIHPGRVEPKREDGRLYYFVTQARNSLLDYKNRTDNNEIRLDPENMFHLAGLSTDGIKGLSVISLAARSIGAGLAADQFLASFYQNGAVTSGVLKHPQQLGDEGYRRLKEDFQARQSGPYKAWKPLILEEGMEWETMTMPLKDAQFLESRKFTIEEIARWFRVPPHKIADLDRATYSNIEHQSIEAVQDAIVPWVVRLEQEANYKLIGSRNQGVFYSKVNINGLLRGDSAARATYYNTMRNMGAMNANEIRALEDMNPIPDGDMYVMQGQYLPLEKIGELPEPAPTPDPQQGSVNNYLINNSEEPGEAEKLSIVGPNGEAFYMRRK